MQHGADSPRRRPVARTWVERKAKSEPYGSPGGSLALNRLHPLPHETGSARQPASGPLGLLR